MSPSDNFYRVSRLPPYVLSEVVELKNAARRSGEDIIDLGMGNPDDAPPDFLIQHLHRDIYKLRVAITDWYKRRYDLNLDPDAEAIVTIGAKEGISHLMLAILGPGEG